MLVQVCTVNAHKCQRGFAHSGTAVERWFLNPPRRSRRNPIGFQEEKGKREEIDSMVAITQRRPVSRTTASPFGHSHQVHSFWNLLISYLLTHRSPVTLQPDIPIWGWVNLDLVAIQGRTQKALLGLPWWRSGWESACQCKGHGFEPWSGKIPHAAEQQIGRASCRERV